ncbi:hypothetical protein XELAEV_18026845mg [Xenopus laevis]|uniref:Uncharacterized protein n=1 Tax=Xenopus laevis TaxID=8355 RepID=A0A974HJE1_XENLA|nr:hypothetical protein XELAEV_18026845mg [Xenopus laevis]
MIHCTSMMRNVVRAWKQVHLGHPTADAILSPFTPLWFNTNLEQLLTIPEPVIWAQFNVKYVNEIYVDNAFLTFDQLKDKFNLPNRMFFRFLQLRHALTQQFRSRPLQIKTSPIEDLLRKQQLNKPLSTLYGHVRQAKPSSTQGLYQKWIVNIPDLTSEQWNTILQDTLSPLIRSRDRLIQFKYLHKAYYTPSLLHKINPAIPDQCNRCKSSQADFFHIIHRFWTDIVTYLTQLMALPIEHHPTVLLLNYLADTAKKAIAIKWKEEQPPTLHFWIGLVEQTLPILEQIARGCPAKFNNTWSLWILHNDSYSNRPGDSPTPHIDWLSPDV